MTEDAKSAAPAAATTTPASAQPAPSAAAGLQPKVLHKPTAHPIGIPMRRHPAETPVSKFPVSAYSNRRRAKATVAAQKRSTPAIQARLNPQIIPSTQPKPLVNAPPRGAPDKIHIPVGSDADAKA